MKFPIIFCFIIALSACAKPYAIPAFDAGHKTLNQYAPDVHFNGLAYHALASPTGKAQVFWTHGMCHTPYNWINDRSELIASALNATVQAYGAPQSKIAIEAEEKRHVNSSISYTTRRKIETKKGEIDITFFTWSPRTISLKKSLLFDLPIGEGGDFQYKRASLNEILKSKLMNDCLADAVIIAGPNRKDVYQDTRKAMCHFLGGRILQDTRTCHFYDHEINSSPRILISESLGSKIMADAIISLEASSDQPNELNRRLATVKQVFLIANQIPILDLAGGEPIERGKKTSNDSQYLSSSQTSFMRMMHKISWQKRKGTRSKKQQRNISGGQQVIAFTDPNDMLSYRLLKKHMQGIGSKLVNVIVSNDKTYTLFSERLAFERLDTAHCGYRANATVMAMLAAGNPGLPNLSWKQSAKRFKHTESKECDTVNIENDAQSNKEKKTPRNQDKNTFL